MALVKLPFIFSAIWGMNKTLTPPNVPSADEQTVPDAGEAILYSFTGWGIILMKSAFWASALGETGALLSPHIPTPPPGLFASLLGGIGRLNVYTPVTPAFLTGAALMTSSGLLRWLCYRTLGRFFTFQLSVRKEHALVTEGPYSIVRHPSYTGMFMGFAGFCVMNGSRRSWLRTSGVLNIPIVRVFGLVAFSVFAMTVACLGMRIPKEDEMLRKKFGDEWENWARHVRYRLIPGVW
ncbi:hypothetical protein BJ138DRAFT_1085453 [Hygrophoropsis aurantiaca]|uniref:Uncharacterized protein n=1 Tax=Hygrophoropsis aurantiaca TaxID=72124 RepID=A0ACB8AE69_9AGAM|nr:hypothetical protein BJ138DRAFT_1085453 [Hygrophoropsis aurantiaca]